MSTNSFTGDDIGEVSFLNSDSLELGLELFVEK